MVALELPNLDHVALELTMMMQNFLCVLPTLTKIKIILINVPSARILTTKSQTFTQIHIDILHAIQIISRIV